MKRKRGVLSALTGLLFPVAALAALLCFATALEELSEGRSEEARRQLEEALRRGCVACFTVRYRALAENLMPEITVLENEP